MSEGKKQTDRELKAGSKGREVIPYLQAHEGLEKDDYIYSRE